jgi:hypothetical protein
MGTEAPKISSGHHPSWRRQGWGILRVIGSLGGTLVLVPLVVILFGSHWEWSRSLVPDNVVPTPPSRLTREKCAFISTMTAVTRGGV